MLYCVLCYVCSCAVFSRLGLSFFVCVVFVFLMSVLASDMSLLFFVYLWRLFLCFFFSMLACFVL